MNIAHLHILVVEDEPVVREDLLWNLKDLGCRRLSAAANAEAALHIIDRELPDLALIDIHLGEGQNGIQLARQINRAYRIPFIYLTAFSDDQTLSAVKETMPAGFVLKPFDINRLRAALQIAYHNYYAAIRHRLGRLEDINERLPETLTAREMDLLRQICEGASNKQMAEQLFLSVNTIKTHLKNLYLKLDANNRAEVILKVQKVLGGGY